MLERIKEINTLEDLTKYIKEDLSWYYDTKIKSNEYTESQIKKIAIIATFCNIGKKLEMSLNKNKYSTPFSFYIIDNELYFSMYNTVDLEDPFLYITYEEKNPVEKLKHALDRYTYFEIAKICEKASFRIFLELKQL